MKTKISYEKFFAILWEAKRQTSEDVKEFDLNYDKELLIIIDDLLKVITESNAYEFVIVENNPF